MVAASIGVALMLTSSTSDRTHEMMRFIKIWTWPQRVIFVAAAVRPSFYKNTLRFNVLLGVCAA